MTTPDSMTLNSFLSDIDANGGSLLIEKLNIKRKDGKEVLVSALYSIIRNTAEEPIGVTAIIRSAGGPDNNVTIPDTFAQTKSSDKKGLS